MRTGRDHWTGTTGRREEGGEKARRRKEKEKAGEGRRRKEKEKEATNIKSNNPHLAGGEKHRKRAEK